MHKELPEIIKKKSNNPIKKWAKRGVAGGSVVKNPADAGDTFSVPDLGRSHMPQNN